MADLFQTRLTELLGLRLPIIAGGLQWLSNAEYVAAAARAGMIGFVTAVSFDDLGDLRKEIRRCRDLAEGGPFGVNVSMLPKMAEGELAERIFDLVIEEGVPVVETSGRNPESYLPRLREAGVKVIHKVPALRFARKAESIGVDAVSLVGAECGGHPGMELIGTMVQAALAGREISIPLIIGGGIGSGSQIVAALAMGADGVIIGTRFLVAEEIWAHTDYKRRLVEADETATTLVLQSLRNTVRALRNRTAETVGELEAAGKGDLETLMPYISGKLGRRAYETGDTSEGLLSVGQSVAFADRVEPLASIARRLEEEAREAMARLDRLYRK